VAALRDWFVEEAGAVAFSGAGTGRSKPSLAMDESDRPGWLRLDAVSAMLRTRTSRSLGFDL
jgi:hypothetical protein